MTETLTAIRSTGHLIDFTSFFELFAALNLVYAGSERFRVVIDNKILKIYTAKPQFSKDLETFKEMANISTLMVSENVSKKTSPITKVFNKRIEIFTNALNEGISEIEKKKCASEQFINGFNCMFLITSLYCIMMVAIAGFEQFLQPITVFNMVVFLQLSLVFNCFIFFKSFTKFKSYDLNPLLTIAFFIFFLILGIFFSNSLMPCKTLNFANIKGVYLVGMVLAVSPYLIHLIRAKIHTYEHNKRAESFFESKANEIASLSTLIRDFSDILLKMEEEENNHA